MRACHSTVLLAVLIAASCQPADKAAEDRWNRFRSVGSAPGEPMTVPTMSPAEQVAVYQPLLPGPAFWAADSAGHPIDDRATLDARLLADDGGSGRAGRMSDALRAALLATERFAATCDHDIMHPCADVPGTIVALSPIHGIAPGVVRVNVLWTGEGSATEVMFRLEQRDGKWVVTDQMTVLIT